MNKKISVGVSAAIIIIAVTITFTATMIFSMKLYDQKVLAVQQRANMFSRLYEMDTYVRENFYAELGDATVSDSTLVGYLNGLGDPYTRFLTEAQVVGFSTQEAGRGISCGFSVTRGSDGYMYVKDVITGSTASKNGLQTNDLITSINGQNLLELGFAKAAQLIEKASEGDNIYLVVNRSNRSIDITAICENLSLYSVERNIYELSEGLAAGYLRISKFNSTTEQQFANALAQLRASGVVGLIVDLRGNNEGLYLSNLQGPLDSLVGTGVLVSATYAGGVTEILLSSDAESAGLPIVVIVDEKTEYLAEVFAAVLREKTSCLIVGKKTAGHGTAQSLIRFTDGSGMLITTARLNMPNGISFDGVGISPDYEVEASDSFVLGEQIPSVEVDPQFSRAMSVLANLIEQ